MTRIARALVAGTLALALAGGAGPARAADAVTRAFTASFDQVWAATRSALESLGWDIDEEDKAAGWIVTDDEDLEFKDFGVYGEGTRHLLRIQLKTLGNLRTEVAVTREVFREERILWTKKRRPIEAPDTKPETAVIQALERSFAVAPAAAPPPPAARPAPAPAAAPPPARGEFTFHVTYVVKGTAPSASLTYRNARGGTEQRTVRLPWEMSFDARAGEFLSVSAQNESPSGSVTCEILIDGNSKTSATSSGAYVTADCSHAAGRN